MRRRTVLALLLLLVAALAARARRRRRPALAAPGAPLRVAQPPPALPAPPAQPPAVRFVSVPWTLADPPGERAELQVDCLLDEQMQLDRVDVRETPTQVFVTALVRWQAPAEGVPAWSARERATVALSRPLGERELVHAPCDVDDDAGP